MAILTTSLTFFINDHYIIIVMNNKFTWNSIVALTPLSIISWKHCRSLSGNSNVNSTADVQDKSTAIRKNWIVCIDSMASISCFLGSLQPDNGNLYELYRIQYTAMQTSPLSLFTTWQRAFPTWQVPGCTHRQRKETVYRYKRHQDSRIPTFWKYLAETSFTGQFMMV